MKTKEYLLDQMTRQRYKGLLSLRACKEAIAYVTNHAAHDAETIGLTCSEKQWLVWFLWPRLTEGSRALLAERAGFTAGANAIGGCYRPRAAHQHAPGVPCEAVRNRAALDDCWHAWCRS